VRDLGRDRLHVAGLEEPLDRRVGGERDADRPFVDARDSPGSGSEAVNFRRFRDESRGVDRGRAPDGWEPVGELGPVAERTIDRRPDPGVAALG
jgi:hypothetical protein